MREAVESSQATDRDRRAVSHVERLLERWRPHRPRRLTHREGWVEFAAAASFVAVALALPLAAGTEPEVDPAVAVALVLSFAVASRVRLYFGAGYAMPTQLVLVPMLFLLPPATVPGWVAAGFAIPALVDALLGRAHAERILTGVGDAWHAVGPSLVFVIAGSPDARLGEWPVLAVALLAQCATDLLTATAREWLGRGIPPAVQTRVIASVYLIDICLTPVGLLVAVASVQHPLAVLFAFPLIALLGALARDRRMRIEEALASLDELAKQHARMDRAIHRVGEAFASKLDRTVLVDLVLRTAVEALGADCGRATLASGAVDWAVEPKGLVPERALAAAERAALKDRKISIAERDGYLAMAQPLLGEHEPSAPDVLSVARRGPRFTEEEEALLGYLTQQSSVALENVALHDRLRRQATVDELTGLANHRRFQDALAHEVKRTHRSGRPLALVLLDVDDFKAVNDTHGHRQGDVVLREVAGVLRRACRATDEPARYGGEELAVILSETDLDGAFAFAETIRRAVHALEVPLPDGSHVSVTVSLGVSALDRGAADAAALIESADAALYDAKHAGKNCTRRGGWVPAGVHG